MKISKGLKIGIALYVALVAVLIVANKLLGVILLPLGGAAWLAYVAYKASKSGSIRQKPVSEGGGYEEGGNMPMWALPQFWFAAILAVATIVMALIIHGDK